MAGEALVVNLPVKISGRAGISETLEAMKEPSYLKLMGKAVGTSLGAGLALRRLPPALAGPAVLLAGIYIGLEMAAWMEEEAQRKSGPMIDATAEPMFHGELDGETMAGAIDVAAEPA